MYRVVIDPRRRWHWDEDLRMYVEEKIELGEEPPWWEAVAEALAVHQPEALLRFPPRCPHCGGVTTTARTLSAERRRSGVLAGVRTSNVAAVTVPTCARTPRPLSAYFLQLFLAFVCVVAFFATMTTPYAALVAIAGLVGSLLHWRARTWIHLPIVVDNVLVLDVRDAVYAHSLARVNHGRVEGRRPAPELPPGDEARAPLPKAIVKK